MRHVHYNLGEAAPSWYEASVKRESFSTLKQSENLKCDVCVVGGGFTGVSAALELALQGRKVILLEARKIGFGASGRNGGQVIGGFHHGYNKIAKEYGEPAQQACYEISEAGKKLIESRVEKYNIDCRLHWGYTHLAIKKKHLQSIEEDLTELQKMGYKHSKPLNKNDIGNRLNSDLYIGGWHDSYSGHIHPLRYLLGIASAAQKNGAMIYENACVTSIDCDKGTVFCGEKITIQAENIIVAGNAYIHSQPLLPPLYKRVMPVVSNIGATRPLTQEEKQLAVKNNDAYADYNFIVDYFRMSHDDRLLFGGRAAYGGCEPKDMHKWMQKRIAQVFPSFRHMPLDYVWGGKIAVTFYRYPDVGKIGKRGFYAQGYCGHGVLLSNMCGKILADTIIGTQNHFDVLASFKQRNFLGGMLRTPALVLGMLYYRLQDAL